MATSPPAFTITLNGPTLSGTRNLSVSKPFTGNREDGLIESIAAGVTAEQHKLTFPYGTIQLAYLLSKGGACTIHTNAADATGGDTIELVAERPTLYEVNGPYPNPFSHDVATMYFTNAGAVAVQVDVYVLNLIA